jgi:hypothetical protein
MIGQRVVCIKEQALNNRLKIGKLFTITNVTSSRTDVEYWTVIDDEGYTCGWIETNYFRPLSEIRQEKLQELGIK